MSGKLTGFQRTMKTRQQQEILGARVSEENKQKSIYCPIAGLLSSEVSSDFYFFIQ